MLSREKKKNIKLLRPVSHTVEGPTFPFFTALSLWGALNSLRISKPTLGSELPFRIPRGRHIVA